MSRRGWRARFSLRVFLLLTALIGAVVSHVLTSLEVNRLRNEARRLRDDLGYLTLTDVRKLHAIALAPELGYTQRRWRWRIFFPSGRTFRVCYKFTELPADDVPDGNYEFFDDVSGEVTLTASAVADADGAWKLVLHTKPEDYRFATTRSQTIANSSWLDDDTSMAWLQAGSGTTETVEVGESMVLLRLRRTRKGSAPQGTTIEPDPTDGIVVWVEEPMVTSASRTDT